MPQASARWLFWTPTLVWASTWHVILYQLAETPALTGVAWRFGLAALLLAAVARWRGHRLGLPWRWHGALAATGAVQFGLNYTGVYQAEHHIPSGLVAVLFSLMVFVNALSGALFFGRRLTPRFLACAAGGVAGVAIIFWPEVLAAGARPQAGLGLAWGLAAVAAACIGNVATLKLGERGAPLEVVLAWCMGYGALGLTAWGLATGTPLAPGHSLAWWLALAWLSAAGSVLAFLAYFTLAQREGPGRAALTGVLIPVIALAISAALEGWRPQPLSLAGVALCLGSVWWATRPEAGAPPRSADRSR